MKPSLTPSIRRNPSATIPAPSARAFLAHPTRFERVTLAFGALLLTPQPLPGHCRGWINRLNEPHAPVAQLDRALPSEGNSPFPELIFMGLWRVRPRVAVPLPAGVPAWAYSICTNTCPQPHSEDKNLVNDFLTRPSGTRLGFDHC
jgi:hypothetical protein